jgi:glycosyltransferase involved in cell wall biosynthesis
VNEAKVSFITVTHNHEKYIRKCIKSVLGQTFGNWEMIIIDDGSTDKTCDIVRNYHDKRIKLIEQGHKGIWNLTSTYNEALRYCSGEFVAILEGDDYSYPDRLEKSLEAVGNAVGVCGKATGVNDKGDLLKTVPVDSITSCSLHNMLMGCQFANCTYMIRTDVLRSINGFQKPCSGISCDYSTQLSLLSKGKIVYIDHLLSTWVKHGNNASIKYENYTRLDLEAIHAFNSWPKKLQHESGWNITTLKLFWVRLRTRQTIRKRWVKRAHIGLPEKNKNG